MRRIGGILVLVAVLHAQVRSEDFYQDFRGQPLQPVLLLYGKQAAKMARSEAHGYRITIPANRPKPGPIGITPNFTLTGAFEVTVGYQLVKVEKPTRGIGAGVNLRLMIGKPMREATGLARYSLVNGREVYVAARTSREEGKDPKNQTQKFPAQSNFGRLRLKRVGSTIHYSVAEGTSNDFRELYRDEFPADKCTVRLAASTGGSKTALDVRFLDFRVGAEQLPSGRPMANDSDGWLVPVFLGVAVLVLVGGGIFWWRKRTRDREVNR